MHDALAAKLKAAPAAVYPHKLETAFPRILDRFVDIWGNPRLMEEYFKELMIDERGDRHGFPEDILMEILDLRSYYRSLYPQPVRTIDSWMDMIDKDQSAATAPVAAPADGRIELAPVEPTPKRSPEI